MFLVCPILNWAWTFSVVQNNFPPKWNLHLGAQIRMFVVWLFIRFCRDVRLRQDSTVLVKISSRVKSGKWRSTLDLERSYQDFQPGILIVLFLLFCSYLCLVSIITIYSLARGMYIHKIFPIISSHEKKMYRKSDNKTIQ